MGLFLKKDILKVKKADADLREKWKTKSEESHFAYALGNFYPVFAYVLGKSYLVLPML